MAHDIIMPALGMVQDTGIIVAWHKRPGDQVKATDILMEVETDKATVEVEAGHDGFLASLRADTGVPIPVGQVVAVVSDDEGDVDATPTGEAAPPAEAAPATAEQASSAPEPADKAVEAPAPALASPPTRPASRARGRILASPKARRLAKERGIDLGRLTRLGVPEPIHVADLEKAAASTDGWQPSLMRVRIEREPFEQFLKWIEDEAGAEADGLNVWAAFAGGSLRTASGRARSDDIFVAAHRFPGEGDGITLKSPDLASLSAIDAAAGAGDPQLTVLDLTDTMLTEYRPAGGRRLPHLTICNGQDAANFDLYLESDPAVMPAETAYAFLKDLAERARVPLRHLL